MLDAETGEQVVASHPVSTRPPSGTLTLLLNLCRLVIVGPLLDPLVIISSLPLLPLLALALAALFLLPPGTFALSPLFRCLSPVTVTVSVPAVAIAVTVPILVVALAIAVTVPIAVAITVVSAMSVTLLPVFAVPVAVSSRRR